MRSNPEKTIAAQKSATDALDKLRAALAEGRGNWGQAASALQELTTVDVNSTISPLAILQGLLRILKDAQLTTTGPIKLKLYELISAYSLAYHAEKIRLPESTRKKWQ